MEAARQSRSARARVRSAPRRDGAKQFFFLFYIALSPTYACCFVMRKTFRCHSALLPLPFGCPASGHWRINARRGVTRRKVCTGELKFQSERKRNGNTPPRGSQQIIYSRVLHFFDELPSCELQLTRLFIQAQLVAHAGISVDYYISEPKCGQSVHFQLHEVKMKRPTSVKRKKK